MDTTLQRALEIAGWPKWEQYGDGRRLVQYAGNPCWYEVMLGGGPAHLQMADKVAHAIIEKHLREWLHERKIAVVWSNFAGQYVAKRWGSDMIEWKSELGPDYLAALAAAVVECGTEPSHA